MCSTQPAKPLCLNRPPRGLPHASLISGEVLEVLAREEWESARLGVSWMHGRSSTSRAIDDCLFNVPILTRAGRDFWCGSLQLGGWRATPGGIGWGDDWESLKKGDGAGNDLMRWCGCHVV